MSKTVAQIRSEIERLQRSAHDAISNVRNLVARHGLTVEDVFGESAAQSGPHAAPARVVAKTVKAAAMGRAAKFGDKLGNTWSGMGKRPGWFLSALNEGKTTADLLLGADGKPQAAPAIPAAPISPVKQSVPAKSSKGNVVQAKAAPVKAAAAKSAPEKAAAAKAAPAKAAAAKSAPAKAAAAKSAPAKAAAAKSKRDSIKNQVAALKKARLSNAAGGPAAQSPEAASAVPASDKPAT